MFKPTVTYCEVQKRQKMIIGMHLFELPNRFPQFTIVGARKTQRQKTTSQSQNQKLEFLTLRHMTTLPVTPASKSPSFLESSRLLVLKQVIVNFQILQLQSHPKNQVSKTQGIIINQIQRVNQIDLQEKTENLNKKCNQSLRVNETLAIPQQKKSRNSIRNQYLDSQPSDQQDFIDYVSILKLFEQLYLFKLSIFKNLYDQYDYKIPHFLQIFCQIFTYLFMPQKLLPNLERMLIRIIVFSQGIQRDNLIYS